jgi:hypothetical protein
MKKGKKVEVVEPMEKREVSLTQVVVDELQTDGDFYVGKMYYSLGAFPYLEVSIQGLGDNNQISFYGTKVDSMKIKLESLLGFVNTALAELDRL